MYGYISQTAASSSSSPSSESILLVPIMFCVCVCVCVSWKSKDNERDHNIYVLTYNLFPLPEFISLQNLKKGKKKLVFFIFECEKKSIY